MITFPNAKINLGLNVVSRRADGYHDLETVFYPIALCDSLEIVPSRGDDTSLTCHGRMVECEPEQNLVMKAYRLMQKHYGIPPVEMHLLKHIPHGAGLGGGSADATTALIMLNRMFKLSLTDAELAALAATLGADCPFFVYNRPLKASGIGDVFSEVNVNLGDSALLLIKPEEAVSTREAYAHVVPQTPKMPVEDIVAMPVEKWRNLLVNDFEESVFKTHTRLAGIKRALYDTGAIYAAMSGSGSAMFGVFESVKMAENAAENFSQTEHYVIKTDAIKQK